MKVYPRVPTSRIKKYCSCLEFDECYSDLDSFRRFGEDLMYILIVNKTDGIFIFFDEFEPVDLMVYYKLQVIDEEERYLKQLDKIIDSWIDDYFPRLVRDGFAESVVNIVDVLIDATCFLQLTDLQIKFMEYRRTLPAKNLELL